MSGRIRTIKPELLEDERTGTLTNGAWRLFVSMLLLSDDYGNLRCNIKRVEASVFWGCPDSVDIEATLDELEDRGLIKRYNAEGQAYAHINGWSKHQRIDKPGRPLVPSMDGELDGQPAGIGRALDGQMDGFTYIARRGDDGPIKIGFSRNPEQRMVQLSRQQAEQVKILATIPGRKHEKALHRRFHHIRKNGEWFEATDELLEFVSNIRANGRALDVHDGHCPLATDLDHDLDLDKEREEDPETRERAGSPPLPDPTLDSLTGRSPKQRPDVLELFELWKRTFKFTGDKLGRGHSDPRAKILADAIDDRGLDTCKRILAVAPNDGMVSGRDDEKRQKHDSIPYLFDNPNTFARLLRAADEAERIRNESPGDYIDRLKARKVSA